MGCNHCGTNIWKALKSIYGKGRKRDKNHIARTDASVNAGENGVQRVVLFNPEHSVFTTTIDQVPQQTPWDPHQKLPQTITEPVISPSIHAFTAGILHPPPATDTREVVQRRSANSGPSAGIYAGYWYDHRSDIDGSSHTSYLARNDYGLPESGIFRWSPESDVDVHRREYYCSDFPTPVRERIHRQNRDSNHIATMFSDENPNACYIV